MERAAWTLSRERSNLSLLHLFPRGVDGEIGPETDRLEGWEGRSAGVIGLRKELVARAVHAYSRRKNKHFVRANCVSSEAPLESELFGHAKGAFTGAVRARGGLVEEADGGTLFLDEVTETTPAFQSKLLRTLQAGEVRRVGESTSPRVDVRLIASTHCDIEQEVREKRFRQALYYCLNVVPLHVPPLRERLEDIPALAEHLLQRVNTRSTTPKPLSKAALEYWTTTSPATCASWRTWCGGRRRWRRKRNCRPRTSSSRASLPAGVRVLPVAPPSPGAGPVTAT